MSDKERLERIAAKLKEKQKLESPRIIEEDLDEEEEGFGDVDVKLYDDVFQHVMHKRHKIKQRNPDKIRKIEEECHHPNQTEDLHEIALNFDKSGEDDFVLTDLEVLDPNDFMVPGEGSPAEVSIVNETPPGRHLPKSKTSPRTSAWDDVILTSRDVRLGSLSSENSMDDRLSLDTVSIHSSGSSRGKGSPIHRRLTKSESLDQFSHRGSRASMRAYSVSELDEKEFNKDRNSSRQEVLKQMKLNKKKIRKERKEELATIEKQKQRRREVAVKAKQETIREEVLTGTYSERLGYSLDVLLHKFEQDNNDDIKSIKNAMQLLAIEDEMAKK